MALVDALRRAQSGYRSDVAALVDQLKQSQVFAALSARGNLPSRPTSLAADTSIALYNVFGADGTSWTALFSSREAVHEAGARHGWTTDGGLLQFISFRWEDAITGIFREALESGRSAGIVFDEGMTSELALNSAELTQIAKGDIVPLVNYSSRQPTRGNERVMVGEPAVPPSAQLVDAIRATLAGEDDVRSYRLRQMFAPERDVMPHLVLDIESSAAEPERRRIAGRVGEAIKDIKLAPPGYLDIAFNLKF